MSKFNNLEEYTDPLSYDLENQDFEPDGPFYLELAQSVGGAILELGCGTGRLTIPLAQSGLEMTGLDVVPEMLLRAKQKANNLPIRWVEADARTFQLEMEFDLIFAARSTFQHFLERKDQEAVLAQVRRHLVSEGHFVFNTAFPQPETLMNEERQEWYCYVDEAGREVQVGGKYTYDPVRQVSIETAHRRWCNADGEEQVKETPLALRHFFPQELETLLAYNGFIIVERYGDWDSSPLTPESVVMINVCRKVQ